MSELLYSCMCSLPHGAVLYALPTSSTHMCLVTCSLPHEGVLYALPTSSTHMCLVSCCMCSLPHGAVLYALPTSSTHMCLVSCCMCSLPHGPPYLLKCSPSTLIHTSCSTCRVVDVFSGKTCDDPTLLTTSLRQTELAGLMQLLYAILLSDGPPRHSHSPPLLDQQTLAIAMATIKALNNSAILDLKMVQVSI